MFFSKLAGRVVLTFVAIGVSRVACAQEWGGRQQSLTVSATFAPDSSHIFIGDAEQRRVWTAELGYSHSILTKRSIVLNYEGSVAPFFQERDPTLTGTTFSFNGYTNNVDYAPERVIYVSHAPVGYASVGSGSSVPIYPVYGTMKTYAVAFNPLGVRLNSFSHERIQPTFATDFGVVISGRDLPIDNSSNFNFMFSFGPGAEFFLNREASIRLEYIFRHISNANIGAINPGIDAGVFRLSLSRRIR
jgi:hypothetical protein